MWWTVIWDFLKNPWVLMGLILVTTVGYYKIVIADLEGDVKDLESDVKSLTVRNEELASDLDKTIKINDENKEVIAQVKKSNETLRETYGKVLEEKANESERMKRIIADLRTPTKFQQTASFEKCEFKIKMKGEANEEDVILNSIANIGR